MDFTGFFLIPGLILVIFCMFANTVAHLALVQLHSASGIRCIWRLQCMLDNLFFVLFATSKSWCFFSSRSVFFLIDSGWIVCSSLVSNGKHVPPLLSVHSCTPLHCILLLHFSRPLLSYHACIFLHYAVISCKYLSLHKIAVGQRCLYKPIVVLHKR